MATYTVNLLGVTNSAAKTMIQIKAGSTRPLVLVRAFLGAYGVTTQAEEVVYILRKSAAATVTTFTPLQLSGATLASGAVGGTSATGTNASVEGTDSDVLVARPFSVLQGFEWVAVPDRDDIEIAPGGIIGLKFPTAPASQSWYGQMVFRE